MSAGTPGEGLSEEARDLYLQAVREGGLPVEADPSRGSAVPTRAQESPAVSELLSIGLLRRGVDRPLWIPVDPEEAAENLLLRRVDALISAVGLRNGLSSLTAEYRASHPSHPGLVEGKEEIGQRLDRISRHAQREVVSLQPGGPRRPEMLANLIADDLRMLRRGVRRRVLYLDSVRNHEPTRAYVDTLTNAGGEVRTAPELPQRLFLIDDLAVFPTDKGAEAAWFSSEPSTVALARWQFEFHWERAAPFEPSKEPEQFALPAEQRLVVRMLLDGVKIESIARQLGVAERTVRRRLEGAREAYGVDTNAQLMREIGKAYPDGLPTDW